jgi:hypothetical protein
MTTPTWYPQNPKNKPRLNVSENELPGESPAPLDPSVRPAEVHESDIDSGEATAQPAPSNADLEVPAHAPEAFGTAPESSLESSLDKPIGGEEPEEPAPAPEPPFVGSFRPNPNVDEAVPVLEEIGEEAIKQLAREGSLVLSNFDNGELDAITRAVQHAVLLKQKERRELASRGKAQNYYAMEVDAGTLFVTEQERIALTTVAEYRASLRTSGNDLLLEDGDEWTNVPKRGDVAIAPGNAAGKTKDPVARVKSRLGLATRVSWPFWGSGFHLVIEGPGALEQLALDQRIAAEKVEYGRESSGYVYGAPALYLNRAVVEFALNQVVEGTPGTTNVRELKELLVITDVEPLALAVAAAMHPNGYLLERPCLTSHGGCGHVEERKINLRRMQFVRRSRLTDAHFNVMVRRTGVVDSSQIKLYQEQMRPEVTRLVPLKDNLFLRLRLPTFAQYERIAEAWLSKMDRKAREVSASNATEQEREAYMTMASRIALIMAYGHWIDAILELDPEVDPEPQILHQRLDNSDPEAQLKADNEIDEILESIALDVDMTDSVFVALEKFISDMTIATPCVPKVKCRNCGRPLSGEEVSNHPHLVNVNAVELFFTLLRHRIQRLSA